MDWRQIEAAITPRTRAIMPVHLYGHPAEMQPILDIAHKHGLLVIEDASQAHGATYQGQRVGSLGDIGCFSLYCSKGLGAYGEAGICVTNNGELAETLAVLRDHGSRVRYQHELLGVNARMDEVQAAILNVKLPRLDDWNAQREAHAQVLSDALRGVVEQVPVTREWASHVFYVYVVQVRDRDSFRQSLQQAGVSTGIHYPTPIHLQVACQQYGYTRGITHHGGCLRTHRLPADVPRIDRTAVGAHHRGGEGRRGSSAYNCDSSAFSRLTKPIGSSSCSPSVSTD